MGRGFRRLAELRGWRLVESSGRAVPATRPTRGARWPEGGRRFPTSGRAPAGGSPRSGSRSPPRAIRHERRCDPVIPVQEIDDLPGDHGVPPSITWGTVRVASPSAGSATNGDGSWFSTDEKKGRPLPPSDERVLTTLERRS